MKTIEETRMPLGEHLAELRTRLMRVIAAIFVLSAAGLVFAKLIYGFLMRPVLLALPGGSSALVYTSAIEEINVYLKVGLYAGVCLSMPLLLWEAWGFVAPGLHQHERRMAGPFVFAGTFAFFAGMAFCYFAILPPMFRFLLRDPASIALTQKLEQAELLEDVALSALRAGDGAQATELAARASAALALGQDEDVVDLAVGSVRPSNQAVEERARLEGLGRLCDALAAQLKGEHQDAQSAARARRVAAIDAWERGDHVAARSEAEACAAELSRALAVSGDVVESLWRLEDRLAQAAAARDAMQWTRPMLSMSQQLSLVVVLELSTGAIFELPLVMLLLGLVGVLESRWLVRYQRHAFVFCIVAAAVITPTGDPVNLALMAGPLLACFETGVLLVWLVERRRARRDTALTT
jgi:sec-independent protein translocase protein TatC